MVGLRISKVVAACHGHGQLLMLMFISLFMLGCSRQPQQLTCTWRATRMDGLRHVAARPINRVDSRGGPPWSTTLGSRASVYC